MIIIYEVLANMEGIPIYSYSRLNSFSTCPYEYYLNYILPHKERPRTVTNGFSDIGTFSHALLEDFANGKLLQFELTQTFLDKFDENVPHGVRLYFNNGSSKDLTDKYREQCCAFFDKFNGFPEYEQVSAEEDFKVLVKINKKLMILRGIIDCVLRDSNGNYIVVDFKSKSEFKSEEELKEYSRQLYFYSIWIKYKFGEYPKTMQFLQFRIGVTTNVVFSEEGLQETLGWIYSQSEKIEKETYWEPYCYNLPTTQQRDRKTGEIKLIEDTFYPDNLCQYRFSCKYSRHYNDGNE